MGIVLMAPVGSKYAMKIVHQLTTSNQLQQNNSCHQGQGKQYTCAWQVIEYYKVDTQTIQCHLKGYSWKKGTVPVVSSKKGRVQVVGSCKLRTTVVVSVVNLAHAGARF